MLNGELKNSFTIGIVDDVTNLSLNVDSNFKINDCDEFLLYGFGSDGMVSASKSMIKVIGENTSKYVQGYFQYDSKKSGGVTISHLRFSDNLIRKPYYVENPKLIVVTKDSYLFEYDIIDKLVDNGVFILNTTMNSIELNERLPRTFKEYIREHNISFYVVNAYELADKIGLPNKISTIMESIIFGLSGIMDYEVVKTKLKEYVKAKFFKKGDDVVLANYAAIDEAMNYISKFEVDYNNGSLNSSIDSSSLYEMMTRRKGEMLKTSDFLNNPDGTFVGGTSALEKRGVSNNVPNWINENCIQCNQCSFVCPHSVIRPFLLNEEEYNNAPLYVKNMAVKALGSDYYYCVGISALDCTGCGLCIKNCLGKKGEKALTFNNLDESLKLGYQEGFDYLVNNVSFKNNLSLDTVKGSQFKMPKFEFCGACAGCGETNYIKVLTQLFGDHIMISNATGCSSIYGGSAPITPYKLPWANSLFEDNAEYGYGMLVANRTIRNRIKTIMENNMDNSNSELFREWLENSNDYEITKKVYDSLDYSICPKELSDLREYITYRSIWTIGGDGWAYDIGFGGIDHVLASGDNVNILVLDTQMYSNTGGQSSKSSPKGSIAPFTMSGKKQNKKDLAKYAMTIPGVYVAQISLGANMMQVLKAFREAESYKGPSIIIAYAPCISHGIKGGMQNSVEMQKKAVECGYFPIFRYNPVEDKFNMDCRNVNFDLYDEFLNLQNRYLSLKKVNPMEADELLSSNKEDAMRRYKYYEDLNNK